LIVSYTGDIAEDAIFDPAALSAVVAQIKLKATADMDARDVLRPVGILRDLNQPLPYLALLMELGNESRHQPTSTKCTVPQVCSNNTFQTLTDNWIAAAKQLRQQQDSEKPDKKTVEVLKKKVKENRQAMDSYNRYSISVCSASSGVYGILTKAGIVEQFKTLLSVTMPSSTEEDHLIEHMRPLEHLGKTSAYTEWMSEYVVQD